jgi:predicted amidophosphoribosyltransferase
MKTFRLLFLAFTLSLSFLACNSTQNEVKQNSHICPQCNMELPRSNVHTATLEADDEIKYFDDVGCMVLWAQKHKIDLKNSKVQIFANDTAEYIDAKSALYSINEKTPMHYGFSAYEKKKENLISFDEMQIRMLRGEHMANPKIRKHILGY